MSSSRHDSNHTPGLIATSNADGITPVVVWADPVTHRLLVSTSGGSATTYTETPQGNIDGANTTYTTAHTMSVVFLLAINGQVLHPQDISAGTGDYTFSGTTITMLTALPASLSGTAFTVVYQ